VEDRVLRCVSASALAPAPVRATDRRTPSFRRSPAWWLLFRRSLAAAAARMEQC
jgi:hypothetical protein